MTQQSGLTIRQHERASFALRVELVIADAHRDQVRFSPISGAVDSHITAGTATDISPGGMGLVVPQFVPRMSEGKVRVFDPIPVGTAADGTPIHEVCFEHRVKVRRVALEAHDPSYALGLAFIDADPDIDAKVEHVLSRAAESAAAAHAADADAGADAGAGAKTEGGGDG